ncbi:MAG: ABC transporter ATP-binding protein [Verrucomicrobiae bacterium]|nr:ABC transporter ATP-binding protein [Verrucomicrobiae bacterium]
MSDAILRLDAVEKRFGATPAVRGVTLEIARGEFFALLGPSGCGKTTLLRLIAGFEQPDRGRVILDGADVAGVPANERPVNTVFQHYALFPHLTVAENVGFGLRYKKQREVVGHPTSAIHEMLTLVRLEGLADRKPDQLSGGQKQRVALARALILRPKVLLLDEPLAALDVKLRKEMQMELKALQRRVGITFVFVTHDQEEALTLADRVAVMNLGKIEQVGATEEIFERPRTRFVADFMGAVNFFDGFVVRPEKMRLHAAPPAGIGQASAPGANGLSQARRESTHFPTSCCVEGTVESKTYQGETTRWQVRAADGKLLTVVEPNDGAPDDVSRWREGGRVWVTWDKRHQVPLQ